MLRRGSIGAALLALALFACDGPVARPPSVLLLTVDTLRPDYMSMNGYDRATTPVLDSLIAGGFYFEQAVTPVPRTTPALASLLTGAYPHTTGVRTLTDRLAGEVVPLAEVMAHSGYQTVAVVTNQVLARRDLDRGFTVYDVAGDIRSAQRTSDAALRWVESLDPAGPVFAWVHYIDPHTPYHSDPTIARRFDPHYHGPYRFQFGATGRPDAPAGSHHFFPKDLPKSEANALLRRLDARDARAKRPRRAKS